jgi:hypothetical protein
MAAVIPGMARQSVRASDRRREMVRGPSSFTSEPFSLSVTGAALKAQLTKRIAEDRAWCERQETRLRNEFTSAMHDGLVELIDAVENATTPPRTVLDEEAETIAFHEFLLTVLVDDERYVMTYDELRSLLAPYRPPWGLGVRGCP